MGRVPLSPWRSHVEKWSSCERCSLHQSRSNVVLARGTIPCEVLFVGEAPGRSEDALNKPFIGPAGDLLEELLIESGMSELRLAFTNLIACLPTDDEGDLDEPPYDSVQACAPRLDEFVSIAAPRLLVRVGKHAREYLEPGYRSSVKLRHRCPHIDIIHPGALLPGRGNAAQQDHLRRRAVVMLRKAVEELRCQR